MISLAIVGAGIVGERIIKQLQNEQGVELKFVYDERQDRLEQLKEQYGIPVASSLEQVLESGIDWMYIGTPPAGHSALAEAASEKGIHVLSEKPLAHDAADGERMVKAAEKAGIATAMHFPLMYRPEVREMMRRLEQQEIGNIVRVELQTYFPDWPRAWQQNPWIASRSQGGFVREVFPHYFQLINRMFGGFTIENHQITYPEDVEKCETGLMALARTKEGIPLLLNGLSGIGQKELLQFKVFGEKGVLTLENWQELYVSKKYEERERIVELPAVPSLFEELENRSAQLVPFEEGLTVQRWIDQLLTEV